MSKTKVKVIGDSPYEKLLSIIGQCNNNNQIVFFIKRNVDIIRYLSNIYDKEVVNPLQLLYHFKEDLNEIPKCICGKNRIFEHYGFYNHTCGDKCCINAYRENSKRNTCLKKYGIEFVTQLDSMKKKSKETLIKNFGVDNCTKSSDILSKRTKHNIEKYGVSDPIILNSVRNKNISEAERGLIKIQNGLPDGYSIMKKIDTDNYKLSCANGHTFDVSKSIISIRKKNNLEICNICENRESSIGEQELFNYIISIYDGNIIRQTRKLISPFEIDMVLEDKKLCIEFNGDYWHSIKINDNQYYHLNKLKMCLNKGYSLIQIKENDWNIKKDIIKQKIFNIINNIIDVKDFVFDNGKLIVDLSWYDVRLANNLTLHETILPEIIDVGKEKQWNCGYKIFGTYILVKA